MKMYKQFFFPIVFSSHTDRVQFRSEPGLFLFRTRHAKMECDLLSQSSIYLLHSSKVHNFLWCIPIHPSPGGDLCHLHQDLLLPEAE